MTYTHLTTNELTIIAHSFVQKLKAYRVAQMITVAPKPFIAFIVTWKPVPQLLIIKITICAISNVVAENVLSCHWLNSLISTTKLPRGGRLIPLLGALSAQLVVTGELFTGCLNVASSASMSVPCRCEVSGTRMAMSSAAGRLANWGEVFTSVPRTFRTMPLNLGTLKLIPSKAKSTKGR